MVKKRLIAFLTGTVLLMGGAVPAFAQFDNKNETPASPIVVIADDGETVLLGVREDAGTADGGLIPANLGLLLTGEGDGLSGSSDGTAEAQEGVISENEPDRVGAADLPSSWRTPLLPPAENQGIYSTCWAFAAMKCSEVNLLMNGFGEGTDLSELQLIYSIFFGEGDTWEPSYGSWFNAKGNYVMATSALARHYGAADGAVYPYNVSFSFSESDRTADIAAIDHVIWPGTWPKTKSEWKSDVWQAKNQVIKELIFEYGAVSVSFNQEGTYNSDLNCYYTGWPAYSDEKPSANHAVTLVGWDDGKETEEGAGAFLALNSWGEDWGENGLFWISYSDASLADPAAYVMEAREPGVMRDDTVFSYTGVGYSQTARSTRATRGANVFTAEHETVLDRVGFYLPAGASYTARVLTNPADPADPSSGTEAAAVSGTVQYGGFYKADLPEYVTVGPGESFAVELTIMAEDRNCVLFETRNRSGAAMVCHEGESFYYNGTSWADSEYGVVIGGNTYYLGNIPIYAYGIGEGMEAVPCDADTDGRAGLADLLTVLRNMRSPGSLTNYGYYAADMNRSGSVDGEDASLIAGFLIKEIR